MVNDINFAKIMCKNISFLIVFYQLFTVWLFLYGPISWNIRNEFFTLLLLFIYILSLSLGFFKGTRNDNIKTQVLSPRDVFKNNFKIIFALFIGIKLLMIIRIVNMYNWGSISSLFTSFLYSYSELYYKEQVILVGSEMFGGTLLSIASIASGVVVYTLLPYTIIEFHKLSNTNRLLGLTGFFIWMFGQITAGTVEAVFEVIVITVTSFIIKRKKGLKYDRYKKILLLLLGIMVIIFMFYQIMDDRNKGTANFSQIGENYINNDSIIYSIVPDELSILFIWLDFYVCQGYYGMSLATTLDWYPMFGFGFSRWLCSEVNLIFDGIYKWLYSYRIEANGYAWGDMANWHSAYTFFANDISWFGIPFLMFIIGYIFIQVLSDALLNKNTYAIGLTVLFFELFLFLPGNNFVFATGNRFFAFFVLLFLWLLRYYKKTIRVIYK